MNLVLRDARRGDSERVADVYLKSRRTFLDYAAMAHSEAEVRRWVATKLIPSGGVTVAIVDDQIMGMLATSRKESVSWIDQLYLLPGVVGRGIGSRLLELAMAALPAPIRLYTFQQNSGSRRFYERHGFRAIAFGDGSGIEERCPDVLYEFRGETRAAR